MAGDGVRFLDTNILLRYLLRDDEEKARRALGLLSRVEQGREKVAVSPMAIFEVVFTLQRRYQVPRQQIRDSVKDILSLRGMELPNKSTYARALDLYAATKVSFPDAFHAAYMDSRKIEEIYSWDRDLDRLEGIRRVEP